MLDDGSIRRTLHGLALEPADGAAASGGGAAPVAPAPGVRVAVGVHRQLAHAATGDAAIEGRRIAAHLEAAPEQGLGCFPPSQGDERRIEDLVLDHVLRGAQVRTVPCVAMRDPAHARIDRVREDPADEGAGDPELPGEGEKLCSPANARS